MDEVTRVKVKWKFEIAYLIAKENTAFKKMKPLCDIKEKHGVNFGEAIGMMTVVLRLLNPLQQIYKKIYSWSQVFLC